MISEAIKNLICQIRDKWHRDVYRKIDYAIAQSLKQTEYSYSEKYESVVGIINEIKDSNSILLDKHVELQEAYVSQMELIKHIKTALDKIENDNKVLTEKYLNISKLNEIQRESLELMEGSIATLSDYVITPQDIRVKKDFVKTRFGDIAINKVITEYKFTSVLDIGCGEGVHSDIFLNAGKEVSAIDIGESPYFKRNKSKIKTIIGDFNEYCFEETFDCVWCCHVLEHQPNPNLFLKKVHSILKEDGVLCITVPPAKQKIVGGHVTLWNAGLLLYNLVIAGFDCSEAEVMRYGYNISVIVKNKTIDVSKELSFDAGDIRIIRPYLPKSIVFTNGYCDDAFDGENIGEVILGGK